MLYVGVTNDLYRRIMEHREGLVPGFTKRYGVERLVYFEEHGDVEAAIAREKSIKRWRRAWKLQLIEQANPQWRDCGLRSVIDLMGEVGCRAGLWAPGRARELEPLRQTTFSARACPG